MDYAGWNRVLSERFPNYESRERDPAWEELKQRFAIGQSVTGTVVARAPFGAWIDLGVGFPGLLEIISMADLTPATPQRYRAGEWCPVGTKVTAFVGSLGDRNHQIGLWQVRLRGNSNTNTTSVADIEGPWIDPEASSGLIERCKRYWNVPVIQLPDVMVATYLRQKIASQLMIGEAERRFASGHTDKSELYDGELAEALKSARS
jgi:transcriptional accessory protein Tex/SPT6